MTTYAWDVPGWIAGHRFTDDSHFYDAANSRFLDMAGYTRYKNNAMIKSAATPSGTPTFAALGTSNRRGMLLDQSCQWTLNNPIPWQGTMLIVFRPTFASANVTLTVWRFGNTATLSGNARVSLIRASSILTARSFGPAGTLSTTSLALVSGNIYVFAFAWNQEDRILRQTRDGTTIIASAADPGTTNGNAPAPGFSGASPPNIDGRFIFIGDNLFGTTTPNATDYIHLFEQHFWKGDVIRDQPTKLAAFMTARRTYYAAAT